jgi:hypothetical protein
MSKKIMDGITYAIIACYIDKGMKSRGSKSLIEFNKQKLLDYQIQQIKSGHKSKIPYEIIIVTNFDSQKIEKIFARKIRVCELNKKINPIIRACEFSKYKNIFFIDYGCVFNKSLIELTQKNIKSSYIITTNLKKTELDIGIIYDHKTKLVQHMFFDLPDKFTNMFFLQESFINKLLSESLVHRHNLMYFEILNYLVDQNCDIYNYRVAANSFFIYFNNMRQKNGISKFIKTNQ